MKYAVDPTHLHVPDWFRETLAKANHRLMSSKALKKKRYKSTSANGVLFAYVGARIKEAGARADEDDASDET